MKEAIRQFRHNNSDEFVFGYDKDIIDKELKALQKRVEELEHDNAVMISNCEGWRKERRKHEKEIARLREALDRKDKLIYDIRKMCFSKSRQPKIILDGIPHLIDMSIDLEKALADKEE